MRQMCCRNRLRGSGRLVDALGVLHEQVSVIQKTRGAF